ncbi:phosphotransferase enzyme family protein [Parablautia intestinalis]|uniref:phosphotransferase enzyme family protein n=1 Tax=Parablautia intestinalis TaxID=2320100 RepID=UPI00256EAF41|nr:aminoglycoside phosphotransferase family protein [Parablautia intestinalis]
MNRENTIYEKTDKAIGQFALSGHLIEKKPYGNGHINDTFLLTCRITDGQIRQYILQRMNHSIFKQPKLLMENVVNVTEYLRKMIISQGGDPDRETLNVVRTKDGESYYEDENHNFWRMFLFIEKTICLEKVESPKDFYDSAVAFGNFQRMLTDYPAHTLHETIPNFHNTPSRFQDFKKAVEEAPLRRRTLAEPEIAFALAREADTFALTALLEKGMLPLRVTHNDTKLNNILFDRDTKKALCIIDLDTVMPGLSAYDFGDSIRFGASTGAEDETDLNKIELDLSLFETFLSGFLKGCDGSLTKKEIEMLPMGAKLMTYECGIRFLADYLEGDVYFKIHRENHNLDRARTQFKLVADMEKKWDDIEKIVRKYQTSQPPCSLPRG